MRRAIPLIVLPALLAGAFACRGEGEKEPAYSSDKPLYAHIVLSEDGSKVLKLALDESEGAGKGYDRLYADVNLNGDLTDDGWSNRARVEKKDERGSVVALDSVLVFGVTGIDWVEKGAQNRLTLWLSDARYKAPVAGVEGTKSYPPQMTLMAEITCEYQGERWDYHSTVPGLGLGEKGAPMPTVTPFGTGRLSIMLFTQAGDRNRGNLAIGTIPNPQSGLWIFRCTKDGKPIPARVQVKDKRGKIVHSRETPFDELSFLPKGRCSYFVRLPTGDYEVSVTSDAGPLVGLLATSKWAFLREGLRPGEDVGVRLVKTNAGRAELVAAFAVCVLLVLVVVFMRTTRSRQKSG